MDSRWSIKLQRLKQLDFRVAVGRGINQQSLAGSPQHRSDTQEKSGCNTGAPGGVRSGMQQMLPLASDLEK